MKLSWIKNTDGKPDAMLTLVVICFAVVMVKVLFGGTTVNISGWAMTLDPISSDLAGVLLGTNTAGYVFRRHTDKKFEAGEETDDTGQNQPQE